MRSQKPTAKRPPIFDYKQSLDFINFSKHNLQQRLVEEYSTSQGYFYTKTINNLIEKKQGDVNCINSNDVKFDECKEHLQKYYTINQSFIEVPELLQYYKYYSQDSICFLNRDFAFLASHHDKKKAVLYQKLKKQLNLSDSQQTLGQVTTSKPQQKFSNVLSGLDLTNNNDQSYYVAEVLKKLVNHFGPSRIKTIHKIDSQFKFMAHNLTIGKTKNMGKQGPSLMTHHNMLESTNTSVRNNNCYVKQKKSTSKNNGTHRRFGSCQVPKSAYIRSTNTNPGTLNTNAQDKKNRIRRRKSAELLSYVDLNTISRQIYKKNSVKTQQQIKFNSNNKQMPPQINFRQKMQQLRKKIRQQKQNLSRKPQSACQNKKKLKK